MLVAEVKLYELLKSKIGEKEAEAFVEILDKKVESKFNDRKGEFATKEDLLDLRLATKEDLSNLRLANKEDLSNLRSEILRTVYLTSLGQLLAIVASVITMMLALKK